MLGRWAQRLEIVRVQLGYRNIKDFHTALKAGGYDVSYQTLRNWHRGDREPPLRYWQALIDTFDVSPYAFFCFYIVGPNGEPIRVGED